MIHLAIVSGNLALVDIEVRAIPEPRSNAIPQLRRFPLKTHPTHTFPKH